MPLCTVSFPTSTAAWQLNMKVNAIISFRLTSQVLCGYSRSGQVDQRKKLRFLEQHFTGPMSSQPTAMK